MDVSGDHEFVCPGCNQTTTLVWPIIMGRISIAECSKCGKRGQAPTPPFLGVRRVVYLDQFVLSYLSRNVDKYWKRMRRKLLRLAKPQYWIFPSSTTHLQESAAWPEHDLAKKQLRLLERLSQGRLLQDSSTIEALSIVNAFLCHLDDVPSERLFQHLAYLLPDPECVYTVTPPMLAGSYDFFRAILDQRDVTFPDRTISLYSSGWGDRFINRKTTINYEMQKHVDLLSADLEVYRDSDDLGSVDVHELNVAKTSVAVVAACLEKKCAIQVAIDFVNSGKFSSIEQLQMRTRMYSHLQDAAATALRQGASRFDWAGEHRNDLVDVNFISSYYFCVTDMFVDRFCGGILHKSDIQSILGKTRVWTIRQRDEFELQVYDALRQVSFLEQEALFKASLNSDLALDAKDFASRLRRKQRRESAANRRNNTS